MAKSVSEKVEDKVEQVEKQADKQLDVLVHDDADSTDSNVRYGVSAARPHPHTLTHSRVPPPYPRRGARGLALHRLQCVTPWMC